MLLHILDYPLEYRSFDYCYPVTPASWEMFFLEQGMILNPSNAAQRYFLSNYNDTKILEYHLNLVMLVFIG